MDQNKGIKRRTLVAGTAWAVPAVTIVATAPQAAASVLCTGSFCLNGDFCKLPGNSSDDCKGQACSKGYRGYATITAASIDRVLVYKLTAQGDSPTSTLCGDTCSTTCSDTIPVPAGYSKACIPSNTAPQVYTIDACGFKTSENTTITIDYYIYRCDTGALIEGPRSTSGGAHPC